MLVLDLKTFKFDRHLVHFFVLLKSINQTKLFFVFNQTVGVWMRKRDKKL